MVSLAENARMPVDNPATHLELTMIHEAMILEYSGRHLALIEWAASLKLFNYSCIGLALFIPWGIAEARQSGGAAARACRRCSSSSLIGGAALALVETTHREDAHLPRAGVPRHGVPARRARHARALAAGGVTMHGRSLDARSSTSGRAPAAAVVRDAASAAILTLVHLSRCRA